MHHLWCKALSLRVWDGSFFVSWAGSAEVTAAVLDFRAKRFSLMPEAPWNPMFRDAGLAPEPKNTSAHLEKGQEFTARGARVLGFRIPDPFIGPSMVSIQQPCHSDFSHALTASNLKLSSALA